MHKSICRGASPPPLNHDVHPTHCLICAQVKYQGTAQPFLVFGILTTALAVSQHPAALA